MLAVVVLVCFARLATSKKPHIIHIVADDLGYNDLGVANGGKTITPALNSLISEGVLLTDYYTFRVCAPSRASILTGRYPWSLGFYDMSNDNNHCVHPSFKMLPELLRAQGYRTHATGKWDVGYVEQHCTPTFRGFESFLGYYTACTSDYWYHGAPGGTATTSKCGGVDFHDSVTNSIHGAPMSGPRSTNGTYDRDVFTKRATDIIAKHDPDEPLYLYVAFHNVHDACTKDRFAHGLQAPLATVNMYGSTHLDTWKVQAAMTTELDYGVGNITAALKASGLWDNTLLLFMSDNGGPLDHTANAPLRAGKGSEFEGGYRVVSFVSGPILPAAVRGSKYDGMMHSSDWYFTVASIDGIAGFAPPQETGIVPADGHNLWPALMGANLTSPRTEVIHAVTNRYFNKSLGNVGVQAARFGDWKIITGMHCESQQIWQSWPKLSLEQIPFGRTRGTLEEGTDHARAPLLSHINMEGESRLAPDPTCAHGMLSKDARMCCPASCETCGAPCAESSGSEGSACCIDEFRAINMTCSFAPAPCTMEAAASDHVCLFNLRTDVGEHTNLAKDPQYASLIADLTSRLRAKADAGPDIAIAFADVGAVNKTVDEAMCQQQRETGYLEPIDWLRQIYV